MSTRRTSVDRSSDLSREVEASGSTTSHSRRTGVSTGQDQRGTVTAEAAIVLPVVAAFCLTLVWMVSVAISQVLTVDAARDAARVLARGDDQASAAETARHSAPDGATVSFSESAGTVTATVSVRASAPGWLLVPLPSVTVGSSSTVEVESDAPDEP